MDTIVITGAGGDIGRAVALALASTDANLLLVDIDETAARMTAEKVVEVGGRAEVEVADVAEPNDVRTYARRAAELAGRAGVTGFFNNAGIEGRFSSLPDHDIAAFDQVIRVNVRGVFLGLKFMLPVMADGGSVVNTGSIASYGGSIGNAAYVASKHAVLGMTKTAAVEVADRRIRVNAVCPGPVTGRMMSKIDDMTREMAQRGVPRAKLPASPDRLPFGRRAHPSEIASVVKFLLGPDSSYISGIGLLVDGARLARL